MTFHGKWPDSTIHSRIEEQITLLTCYWLAVYAKVVGVVCECGFYLASACETICVTAWPSASSCMKSLDGLYILNHNKQ